MAISELQYLQQTKQLLETTMALLQYQHREVCGKIEAVTTAQESPAVTEALGGPDLSLEKKDAAKSS